jgi:hypothetical protein
MAHTILLLKRCVAGFSIAFFLSAFTTATGALAASTQTGGALFQYAAFATSNTCGAITLTGNSSTDSFDSSQGMYAATKQNNGGNIGTNGNISLRGAVEVHGTASTHTVARVHARANPWRL